MYVIFRRPGRVLCDVRPGQRVMFVVYNNNIIMYVYYRGERRERESVRGTERCVGKKSERVTHYTLVIQLYAPIYTYIICTYTLKTGTAAAHPRQR